MHIRRFKVPVAAAAAAVVLSSLLVGGNTSVASAWDTTTFLAGATGDEFATPVTLAADDAITFTRSHDGVLGYAWLEDAGVVVDAVGDEGMATALTFRSVRAPAVPVRVRQVERTQAELEAIKHEVIKLTSATVPDGDLIFQTAPLPEQNRIEVSIYQHSAALVSALADRYGDAVTVRVADERIVARRTGDTSPFWGGAKIEAPELVDCTDAFSWNITTTTSGMLTAGHCVPYGGNIFTSAEWVGSVTNGSRENWNRGVGTVMLPGQSRLRGDLALIQVPSGKSSSGRMYRGAYNSVSSAPVKQMWSRRARTNDEFCSGGAVSGERCSWLVRYVDIDVRYWGTNEYAQNVVRGEKSGHCTRPGDSGGPIYTVRSDGGIAAKGVLSGGTGGGSDYYSSSSEGVCIVTFTDIYDAHDGFPGNLKLG